MVEREFDWTNVTATTANVIGVAGREHTSTTDLDLTLHEHVNPDALHSIVTDGTQACLRFAVDDY